MVPVTDLRAEFGFTTLVIFALFFNFLLLLFARVAGIAVP